MSYDPDNWDEEQLHAALSAVRPSPDALEPLATVRRALDELLGRAIDDAYLVLGGKPLMRGSLRARPEHELAALPPHALVVLVDELAGTRLFAVPLTVDPELLRALDAAHGATIGDTELARPSTYPSALRIAAGTVAPGEADTFFILHVMDLYEEWEGEHVSLPTLEDVRAWAGWLLPYRVNDLAGLDLCIARVCAIRAD
ncbi:MAG: hypothetical protein KF729_35810 [Sandaracinaceae bacterium]|nr:hypothetical protein [Sandaracinaceae bacterium]